MRYRGYEIHTDHEAPASHRYWVVREDANADDAEGSESSVALAVARINEILDD